MHKLKIYSLDHIAFTVADVARSLRFYEERLGFEVVRGEEFLRGEAPFPSVRVTPETILDFFPPHYRETRGGRNVDHVAFTVSNSAAEIAAFFQSKEVPVVCEMTGNFAAQGTTAHAFHVADPDGNVLEFHCYE